MVDLAKAGKFSLMGLSGNLTEGKFSKSGVLGIVGQLILVLVAFVFGGIAGNGVRQFANSVPVLNTKPIPEILGGLASFATGGWAGVGGYATTAGLLPIPRLGSR